MGNQTPNISLDPEALYSGRQAADFLGVNPHTLRAWRFRKNGPPYIYLSQNCVRYKRKDLLAFVASKTGADA